MSAIGTLFFSYRRSQLDTVRPIVDALRRFKSCSQNHLGCCSDCTVRAARFSQNCFVEW